MTIDSYTSTPVPAPKSALPAAVRARQLGMTLVELMIAMLLGLLVTAGVIQIFVANRTTYAFTESLSWIQENARFALDHMAADARMAGYVGCLSNVTFFNNLDGPATPFRDDLTTGLQGYNYNGTATGQTFAAGAVNPAPTANANAWTPALPAEIANLGLAIPGSDVLVVRYVAGEANPLVPPFSDSAQLFVEGGPYDFVEGEILVVTDCQKASIFQATNVQATGVGINIDHSAAAFVPGNTAPAAWGSAQSYGLGAQVARLEAAAFFIGRGQSGQPALYQLRLRRTSPNSSALQPEELVEGVDSMQIRYGLDTDNDRQVNVWQTADVVAAANNWGNVLSIEVSLLARGVEEYGPEIDAAVYTLAGARFDPVNDRRLRQVFTMNVGVRNRLP